MDKNLLNTLKKFTGVSAPAGFEAQARNLMESYLEGYVDEFSRDNLGSVITKTTGQVDGPKIMITGHLDEIGFLVTQIDDKGFLRIVNLGGWNPMNLLMQQVEVVTTKGKKIHGVIGSSSKERGKAPQIKDLYIDLGHSTKEEVEKLGVSVGDFVVPYCEFRKMNNSETLLAKAWDNRIGIYVVAEVMRRLKEIKHENVVYGVGAIQEETGCKGSMTSSFLINPDIGIAVDVEFATDFPGGQSDPTFECAIGKGPAITLMDQGTIYHSFLRNFVLDVAKESEIEVQVNGYAGGGTDAASMHKATDGAPSITIGIPMRYMHTNTGMLRYSDVEDAINLILEIIKRLDSKQVSQITNID